MGFTVGMALNLLKAKRMAGESGILYALCYKLSAFNEMPKTVVLTGSYVLSHLEHLSHKKHRLTQIRLITVWTVWIRFFAMAPKLLHKKGPCFSPRDRCSPGARLANSCREYRHHATSVRKRRTQIALL